MERLGKKNKLIHTRSQQRNTQNSCDPPYMNSENNYFDRKTQQQTTQKKKKSEWLKL
jgi:Zn-finger nucleic acid-binding protein